MPLGDFRFSSFTACRVRSRCARIRNNFFCFFFFVGLTFFIRKHLKDIVSVSFRNFLNYAFDFFFFLFRNTCTLFVVCLNDDISFSIFLTAIFTIHLQIIFHRIRYVLILGVVHFFLHCYLTSKPCRLVRLSVSIHHGCQQHYQKKYSV